MPHVSISWSTTAFILSWDYKLKIRVFSYCAFPGRHIQTLTLIFLYLRHLDHAFSDSLLIKSKPHLPYRFSFYTEKERWKTFFSESNLYLYMLKYSFQLSHKFNNLLYINMNTVINFYFRNASTKILTSDARVNNFFIIHTLTGSINPSSTTMYCLQGSVGIN